MTSRLGQKVRVPGGEGPWIVDNSGSITIDGVTDDHWILWADNASPPILTGPAAYQSGGVYYAFQTWIIHFTGTGTLSIDRDSCAFWHFMVHRPTSPITKYDISTPL